MISTTLKKLTMLIVVSVVLVLSASYGAFADSDIVIESVADLQNAILNQADGQTWHIMDGEYNIREFYTVTESVYGGETEYGIGSVIADPGTTGWYFPITADNITIIGESKEDTVIAGSFPSVGGSANTQCVISVWGDNVTIRNLTIQSDIPANKAIDVRGSDFISENIEVIPEGTVIASTASEFKTALSGSATTIRLTAGTFAFDSQIRITKAIRIVGAGDSTVITKGAADWTNTSGSKGYASLITIHSGANAVSLENLKVTGAKNIAMLGGKTDYGSGINVVSSSKVTLKNVTLTNNEAAGLIVNSSEVTADNLNTSGNGWYGVNVDQADSIADTSFTLTGSGVIGEAIQIVSDKGTGITVDAEGYTAYNADNTTKSIWTDRALKGATIERAGTLLTKNGLTVIYSTIQGAINNALPDDTIEVLGGTYTENVNVNKRITLRSAEGAQSTKIVATTGNTYPLTFSTNGATVDGFTLTHAYTAEEIADWINPAKPGFNNNGVTFGQGTSGNTLTNCIVTLNRNGIYLNTCQNNNIINNTITNNRTGINMTGNINGTTITGNTISQNWTIGLVFYQQSGVSDLSTVTVTGNTFDKNWYTEVLIKDSPTSTGILDVTSNTFTDSPVTYATSADAAWNEPGFEDQIPDVPAIPGGTAVRPAKDLPTLRIYNSGSVVLKYAGANKYKTLKAGADEPYKTLQDAINAASAGDTIDAAAGTYDAAQFLVLGDKPGITIKGAGMDRTYFNLTAKNDGFKVQADNVTLKDFTITTVDGDNKAYYGLRAQGVDNLTVQNVKVTKMKKSAFDVNGVTNSSFSGLVATNNGGYGISVNQSKNVTFEGTTDNNGWGAVNVANKPQTSFANKETSGIDISGVVSAEAGKLSIENYNPGTADALTLGGLSISPGTLSPSFSPSVYGYTALVLNDMSSTTITAAVASDEYKSISVKAGLSSGQNSFIIKVIKADDSTANTYTLNVTRTEASDTVTVSNVADFNAALSSDAATIRLTAGTFAFDSQIRITKAIRIVGAGDSTVITKGAADWTNATGSKGYASLIMINSGANAVTLENLKVTGAKNIAMTGGGTDYGSGINVVSSSNVTLKNITSVNNQAAGMIVNSSAVTAENLNTSGNGWYGVNVDKADSGAAGFTLTGSGVIGEAVQIVSDKGTDVSVNAEGYTGYNADGTAKSIWTNRALKGATIARNGSTLLKNGLPVLYSSIQDAINAASAGDTIDAAAGTYDAAQFLVLGDKPGITIKGAGVDRTYFNLTAKNDGFKVQANNVTLKDFTITTVDGDNKAYYGLRAQGVDNLTVQNVKVTKMKKSAFDVNGVTNSSFSGLVATNNGGYGISINQSKNVTFEGTTDNNGWGAINVANKPQTSFANKETSGIDISNVVSAEADKLSIENYNPGTADALTLSGLSISPGVLAQTFSPSVYAYTAAVPNNVSLTTITAAVASAEYKSISVKTSLAVGQNSFTIRVIKADDSTANTYTLNVTRNQAAPPPTDTGNGGGGGGGGGSSAPNNDNQAINEINEIINNEFLAGQNDEDTVNAVKDAIASIEKITDQATALEQAALVIRSMDAVMGASGPGTAVQEQLKVLANTVMSKVNSQTVTAVVTGTESKAVISESSLRGIETKMAQIVSAANQINTELGKITQDTKVEKVLNLDVAASPSVSTGIVDIPASLFTSAATAGIDKVSINTGVASIAIEPGSFAGTGTVELTAKKLDSSELSDAIKAQVRDNPVYDFNMLVGAERVSSFSKQIEVSIPYVPSQGESPDSLTVYYISDSGELVNVSGVYDAATKTVRFTTNHFSIYVVKQNPVTYNDLASVEWARSDIEFLASKGIIKGYGDGTFGPDKSITRAEFIALITRTLKLTAASSSISFNDLQSGSWYYNDIITAASLGLISGDANGNILPDATITRQEIAVIIGKLLVNSKNKTPVANVDIDTYMAKYIDKSLIASDKLNFAATCVKYGILNGISDSLFAPNETITRAHTAAVIHRLFALD